MFDALTSKSEEIDSTSVLGCEDDVTCVSDSVETQETFGDRTTFSMASVDEDSLGGSIFSSYSSNVTACPRIEQTRDAAVSHCNNSTTETPLERDEQSDLKPHENNHVDDQPDQSVLHRVPLELPDTLPTQTDCNVVDVSEVKEENFMGSKTTADDDCKRLSSTDSLLLKVRCSFDIRCLKHLICTKDDVRRTNSILEEVNSPIPVVLEATRSTAEHDEVSSKHRMTGSYRSDRAEFHDDSEVDHSGEAELARPVVLQADVCSRRQDDVPAKRRPHHSHTFSFLLSNVTERNGTSHQRRSEDNVSVTAEHELLTSSALQRYRRDDNEDMLYWSQQTTSERDIWTTAGRLQDDRTTTNEQPLMCTRSSAISRRYLKQSARSHNCAGLRQAGWNPPVTLTSKSASRHHVNLDDASVMPSCSTAATRKRRKTSDKCCPPQHKSFVIYSCQHCTFEDTDRAFVMHHSNLAHTDTPKITKHKFVL